MYVDFTLVAADSIINQVAKLRYMSGGQVNVPLVIRTQQGGGRGNAAQHSQSLDAFFAHVPGLKVVLPATPADAKGMLKAAIRDNNPVIFIEHKLLYFTKGEVPDDLDLIPLDKAAVKREGTDVTIVGVSRSVQLALEAAEMLEGRGIAAEVLDMRSVRPLDIETILESVRKTHKLVLVHEAVQPGSIMSEIAATVQERDFDLLDGPIQRVGGSDSPVAYSLPLEQIQLPDVEKIILAVERVV
jgi:pyruvate dehydrogenase E1 component beta subunit